MEIGENFVGSFHERPSVFPSSLCQWRQIMMIKRGDKTKFGYFFPDDCVPLEFQFLNNWSTFRCLIENNSLPVNLKPETFKFLSERAISQFRFRCIRRKFTREKGCVDISTVSTILHICFWFWSKIIFKTTVKGLVRLSGKVFEIFHLFISLCKYAERKMDD